MPSFCCRDLQANGATLVEILLAGEWRQEACAFSIPLIYFKSAYLNRSASFMKYMEDDELEADAVLEAMWQESDDESAP